MESGARLAASMHSTAMCWAAAEGNLDTVRRLCEEHGADVNAADYDKRTPLHIAVSDGQLEMVKYLLQCGANAEALDRWGRSSIDCAIESKNIAILRVLERATYGRSGTLSLFEDAEKLRSTSDGDGIRRSQSRPDVVSFFQAIEEGNTEKVKRSWLEGMEVNVTDHLGRTSLHVAVETGQIGVIELLLSAGVNTTVVDTFGRSPLSIALETQHHAIAEMLRIYQTMKLGTHSITSREDEDSIALAFQCAKRGEIERLKQLVPARVRPDVDDHNGRTLLHVASAEGHCAMVKYLVDCGANVNVLDRWGSSPLSDAVAFAPNDVAKVLSANDATESSFRATVAEEYLDSATLASAFEYILQVVTRDSWSMGQVHCPMLDDDKNCILRTHRIWQKNLHGDHKLTSERLQSYRTVSCLILIDPGQGHLGRVFSNQHFEWLDLLTAQQSDFILLPNARIAGFRTSLAIPVRCQMATVAVLSWCSTCSLPEDPHEVQRIQRLVRSVMLLAWLRQELQKAATSPPTVGHFSHFQYCQTLDNALTANGELLDVSISRADVTMGDTIPLALEWGLFAMVDTLATSMSSEDHVAVVPLLRGLVLLLHNGFFDDGLQECMPETSLKQMIEDSNGTIRTKWALIRHVQYYLQYLYTVSPTEAALFADVHNLYLKVEKYLSARAPVDEKAETESQLTDERTSQDKDGTVASAAGPECVMCKYKVPGHRHPGRDPIPATLVPAPVPPVASNTSNLSLGLHLFGHAKTPKSPVYRHMEQLLTRLEREYDAFARKPELADCRDGTNPAVCTASDLYDVVGAAHETSVAGGRQQLLAVLNEILLDPSCLISRQQLIALHARLVPPASGHAGVLRTDLAVGFASPRIYRVFLPAGEIDDALDKCFQQLNEPRRWTTRPLLGAYYAFAVLVFYIHPFYDGNGRCARLIGNLVAKKLGFPFLLRAADKTIQVVEFLHKAIGTMEILRTSRRQARSARTRRENASMWF